ncbi:MAG: hypothetical protein ACRDV9_03355 [Acidimicrobiia bacterium]
MSQLSPTRHLSGDATTPGSGRRAQPLVAILAVASLLLGVSCSGDKADEGTGTGSSSNSGKPGEGTEATGGTSKPAVPARTFVAATEYAFAVSGTLVEKTGSLEFRNDGTQLHMLTVNRLREGRGAPQLAQAIQGEDRAGVEAAIEPEEIGAPGGALGPGHRQAVTASELKAGRYAIVCLYPAPDGKSHAAKGMVGELTVVPNTGETTSPAPDHRVTISKDGIEGAPTKLVPGNTSFQVRSSAGIHNFIAVRLEEGKSYPDVEGYFRAFLTGGAAGVAPPGELVGLVYEFSEGQTLQVTFDLEPGRYFLGCTYADENPEKTGDDHYLRAEHVELVVS